MSSNMSLRPPPPPPPERPEDPLEPAPDPDELDPEDPLDPVEYLVDVLEESAVWTSVPKSVHSSQTSSSAPSIFTVLGLAVSAPHISH
jgi:hypothetical protein